jgi:hypothetical protein
MDEHPKRAIAIVMLLVVGTILSGAVFLGGQTSKILSTVGAALPDRPATGGGQGNSSGDKDPATGTGSGSGSGGEAQVADAAATIPTLLIVRTGDLQLEVRDLDVAVRDGDAAVVRAGGYISDSNRVTKAGDEAATVAYRIPSAGWDATLDALHGLASKVDSEQIKTEEVSGQVVDLTARIGNLRSTEAALQAIMAKAARISDVLEVQEQLTTTRGEIEQLVAKKQLLEDQASFGSLAVKFHLPIVPAPTAAPRPVAGWNPGSDVERATARLVRIGQTSTSIGIWLAIVGLPLLFGAVLVTFAGWQAYRLARWVMRRRESSLA